MYINTGTQIINTKPPFVHSSNLNSDDGNFKDILMTVSGRSDAAVFWPRALACCRCISVELDGYQTVDPWEVLPAEHRPGATPQ